MERKIGAELRKWVGIGIMVGTIIGATTNNIGLWLPLGIVFGVAYGTQMQKNSDKGDDSEE